MSGSDLTRPPRRIGSRSLGEFPFDVVRIDCERCGRVGCYAKARLIERFGADAARPDVLMELAACERRKDFSRPCGACRQRAFRSRKASYQAHERAVDDLVQALIA